MAPFEETVRAATDADPVQGLPPPRLDAYAADHAAGVPLLLSEAAGVDLSGPGGEAVARLVARAAAAGLPARLHAEAQALHGVLSRAREERARAVAFLVGSGGSGAPANEAGLLRYLGWRALRRVLAPALAAYDAWRADERLGGEERWMRGDCPTCGALPPLNQLGGPEDQPWRRLACGCCGTRWRFRRSGCPFCGNSALDRLGALEIEGEPRVRIDTCESCRGYLKTYQGEGEEAVFLADWTTLHLDVLARERGLKRVGESLYDL
jgi:FdhE protein